MTIRNTRSGKLAFLLIALVILAVLQPVPAKTQDLEQLRKDAEQGDATAQYQLGFRYNIGQGAPQDDAEAVRWYRLAAEQGLAVAQFLLGVLYHSGEGVPQDYQEALKWYRMAAEQGVADAQYRLGGMYAAGVGVPQNYVQAHKWLNLAASRTTDKAEDYRLTRDALADVKMTASQVAEAQRLAREWRPKSWEQLKDK